jgi:hypothetical protein
LVSGVAEPLVLPEYGPTLPELARRRFGWRERTTVVLLFALAALVALGLFVVRPEVDPLAKYVHHGDPVFNLLYRRSALHRVDAQAAELVRLQGKRGRLTVTIAVEPLQLPPASGDLAHGLLPAFASDHVEELRAQLDHFELRAEGRARVNDAPGYEVRFRTGPPGARTFGNDLMLLPTEDNGADALLVTARRTITGKPRFGKREAALNKATAKAYRSFKYGATAAR